jgi:predicted DNA-binding protein (MmcQ/YjbR family)
LKKAIAVNHLTAIFFYGIMLILVDVDLYFMVNLETLRAIAISFPEATEAWHFEKISFRVKKKIFATYDEKHKRACIKLSEADQESYTTENKGVIFPVDNKWGKQGWTFINMQKIKKTLFEAALTSAYIAVAPAKLAQQMKPRKN